jgi:lipopolysaccharide transport system ATP-binding protein
MPPPAVRVSGLGKRYRFGRGRHNTLRDLIAARFRGRPRWVAARTGTAPERSESETRWFWALRDVSFEVHCGKVLGVIGGNGAGKSTLLKILSRITDPTEGEAEIRGRVGALLEVGTGFHSELSGRENVYLSGAILGLRRAEIKRKFDQIVEFAEVGRFLDMPVKHYSSGMRMRLAFAVAAHLEPAVLLVDEVIAVGDAAFQRKCLSLMSHVASEGRTVLFISHNMAAVQSLCDVAIWLREGRVVDAGPPGAVIVNYLRSSSLSLTARTWDEPVSAPGNDSIRLRRALVRPAEAPAGEPITTQSPFLIEFEYWNLRPTDGLALHFNLLNQEGTLVFNAGAPTANPGGPDSQPAGLYRSVFRVPGDLLNNGTHRVELWVARGDEVVYRLEDVLGFDVHDVPDLRGHSFGKGVGAVRPLLEWHTELVSEDHRSVEGG